MSSFARIAAAGLLSLSLPTASLAQDAKDQPAPAPAASPPAATGTDNPNLTVATVKMDGGVRASKVIGAAVIGANNQEIGTLNDLILDHEGKIVLGVVSVGGVLGMGGKLVAEPYSQFQPGKDGKLTLVGASKDQLAKQPGFTYSDQ